MLLGELQDHDEDGAPEPADPLGDREDRRGTEPFSLGGTRNPRQDRPSTHWWEVPPRAGSPWERTLCASLGTSGGLAPSPHSGLQKPCFSGGSINETSPRTRSYAARDALPRPRPSSRPGTPRCGLLRQRAGPGGLRAPTTRSTPSRSCARFEARNGPATCERRLRHRDATRRSGTCNRMREEREAIACAATSSGTTRVATRGELWPTEGLLAVLPLAQRGQHPGHAFATPKQRWFGFARSRAGLHRTTPTKLTRSPRPSAAMWDLFDERVGGARRAWRVPLTGTTLTHMTRAVRHVLGEETTALRYLNEAQKSGTTAASWT